MGHGAGSQLHAQLDSLDKHTYTGKFKTLDRCVIGEAVCLR